jgi:hypothetical protein
VKRSGLGSGMIDTEADHPAREVPRRMTREPGHEHDASGAMTGRPVELPPSGPGSAVGAARLAGGHGRMAPGDRSASDVERALRAYRGGAPLGSVAAALDLSFDATARLIIACGARRDVLACGPAREEPPAELDDPDWIRGKLETGWTISDIARNLGVDGPVVDAAVTRHGFTVASMLDVDPDIETERNELVERFHTGVEEASVARAALSGALSIQSSAVSELAGGGLTVPAIADRLGVPDAVVLELLDGPSG